MSTRHVATLTAINAIFHCDLCHYVWVERLTKAEIADKVALLIFCPRCRDDIRR